MNFLNYDLDRPFALRSVSIGPKCSGTFYHTYYPFRLYTVKGIPEVEDSECVKTKVGLRLDLINKPLPDPDFCSRLVTFCTIFF